jgi:hypothetical protein
MQPERVRISGGVIEVHPAEYVTVTRQPDGGTSYSEPQHVAANVRVFLDGEDGFFAFQLSPTGAVLLTQAVQRNCPDAIPASRSSARPSTPL